MKGEEIIVAVRIFDQGKEVEALISFVRQVRTQIPVFSFKHMTRKRYKGLSDVIIRIDLSRGEGRLSLGGEITPWPNLRSYAGAWVDLYLVKGKRTQVVFIMDSQGEAILDAQGSHPIVRINPDGRADQESLMHLPLYTTRQLNLTRESPIRKPRNTPRKIIRRGVKTAKANNNGIKVYSMTGSLISGRRIIDSVRKQIRVILSEDAVLRFPFVTEGVVCGINGGGFIHFNLPQEGLDVEIKGILASEKIKVGQIIRSGEEIGRALKGEPIIIFIKQNTAYYPSVAMLLYVSKQLFPGTELSDNGKKAKIHAANSGMYVTTLPALGIIGYMFSMLPAWLAMIFIVIGLFLPFAFVIISEKNHFQEEFGSILGRKGIKLIKGTVSVNGEDKVTAAVGRSADADSPYIQVGPFVVIDNNLVPSEMKASLNAEPVALINGALGYANYTVPILAAMLEEKLRFQDVSVEDEGMGNGVLGLIALRLNTRRVTGIDYDSDALHDAYAAFCNPVNSRGVVNKGVFLTEGFRQYRACREDRFVIINSDLDL